MLAGFKGSAQQYLKIWYRQTVSHFHGSTETWFARVAGVKWFIAIAILLPSLFPCFMFLASKQNRSWTGSSVWSRASIRAPQQLAITKANGKQMNTTVTRDMVDPHDTIEPWCLYAHGCPWWWLQPSKANSQLLFNGQPDIAWRSNEDKLCSAPCQWPFQWQTLEAVGCLSFPACTRQKLSPFTDCILRFQAVTLPVSISLSVCLSACLSVCLSVYLSICLSIYLFIYISFYLPILSYSILSYAMLSIYTYIQYMYLYMY